MTALLCGESLHDAVCCRALQCIAVRCGALQCVAVRCRALQGVAGRCSALQCVALRCSALRCAAVLQCATVRFCAFLCVAELPIIKKSHGSALMRWLHTLSGRVLAKAPWHCVATNRSTLQYVAACRIVSQRVAACCSVLQCVVECCVLQYIPGCLRKSPRVLCVFCRKETCF